VEDVDPAAPSAGQIKTAPFFAARMYLPVTFY
jgi:hypothetical protein